MSWGPRWLTEPLLSHLRLIEQARLSYPDDSSTLLTQFVSQREGQLPRWMSTLINIHTELMREEWATWNKREGWILGSIEHPRWPISPMSDLLRSLPAPSRVAPTKGGGQVKTRSVTAVSQESLDMNNKYILTGYKARSNDIQYTH